ncbi:19236_t:CDS:2 [Gigaspora margarita]|uniref:19236_t:CDS:1 n=1 Tax=Gigaspora margarita TaxID=4874 RepID=A0ABN7WDJ4_GIGMA|nr:19236_t:CDS:2 [Gigaspora margarita]
MSNNSDNDSIATNDCSVSSIKKNLVVGLKEKYGAFIMLVKKLENTIPCSNYPQDKQKYWQDKIENRDNNYRRTSKTKRQISTCSVNTNHLDSLSTSHQNSLDHAVLKAWVGSILQLNSAYHPPGWTTLSGRILDEEIIKVNKEVSKILKKNDNLTLTLDRWSSPQGSSIYNYIITMVDHKEYLVALKDYSNKSNTGEFLASEINTIIMLEKFAAIVTDSGSNCRGAHRITNHDYPHVLDLRCIAHLINLIAEDFKISGYITRFFNKSHLSNRLIDDEIRAMKIKRIQTNYEYILTNELVKNTINNDNFFINCHYINQIIQPVKICIGRLEARTATLADCYINILKLAAAIYQLPKVNPFKLQITKIYNIRYEELNHKAYLLTGNYWKALGYDEAKCIDLFIKFRKFIHYGDSYKVEFNSQSESPLTW